MKGEMFFRDTDYQYTRLQRAFSARPRLVQTYLVLKKLRLTHERSFNLLDTQYTIVTITREKNKGTGNPHEST